MFRQEDDVFGALLLLGGLGARPERQPVVRCGHVDGVVVAHGEQDACTRRNSFKLQKQSDMPAASNDLSKNSKDYKVNVGHHQERRRFRP